VFGTREHKYGVLLKSTFAKTSLRIVTPKTPFYLFLPQDHDLQAEYDGYIGIQEIMPINVLGYQTHRDAVAVSSTREELERNIAIYLGGRIPKDVSDSIMLSSYRLFDERYVAFSQKVNDRPRPNIIPHVSQPNIILGVGRQGQAVDRDNWQVGGASSNAARRHGPGRA
jgi:hypothetical protein